MDEYAEAGGDDFFAKTLADGLGLDDDQIEVESVRAGSVIIDYYIEPAEG